jgi:hypothetical protein
MNNCGTKYTYLFVYLTGTATAMLRSENKESGRPWSSSRVSINIFVVLRETTHNVIETSDLQNTT